MSSTLRDAMEAEPEEIQGSAFVLDTLRTALWAVLRSTSFEDALCLTVNLGNDADTVGAVTGALARRRLRPGQHPGALARAALHPRPRRGSRGSPGPAQRHLTQPLPGVAGPAFTL